jgi:hypothetical protein
MKYALAQAAPVDDLARLLPAIPCLRCERQKSDVMRIKIKICGHRSPPLCSGWSEMSLVVWVRSLMCSKFHLNEAALTNVL